MAGNLRDRLRRIQEQKKSGLPKDVRHDSVDVSVFAQWGWVSCGFQTLKREVFTDAPAGERKEEGLPAALAVLVPDLRHRSLPALEDFLFFDLETTGLSGGAGTVAFLAAFGRFSGGGKLRVTQYLLLDYPGESGFLEAVLEEFKNERSVIVSYNGKCFDSQILKTRCLMNGIRPPGFLHADLLHPARRLWKTIIGDCSQASIETRVLGLDRSGDTPGALAPEIWFEFLRTGRLERLAGICDHNLSDICGLASILAAMISLAGDPFAGNYQYDIEKLALHWRDFLRSEKSSLSVSEGGELQNKGEILLRLAAENNYPRAAFVYALDQLRGGNYEEGRKRLLEISESVFPDTLRTAALRSLAIDSERRLKDVPGALEFVKRGLAFQNVSAALQNDFERRAQRLEKKLFEKTSHRGHKGTENTEEK